MRIIIQYYYDFLRKKTAAVDIEDEEQDCSILLKAISVKVDRPIHDFVASVKKDNVSVRIIQGWPLSFYEIKDKSCLNVEFKDIESEESKKQGQALNNRYLMKLGINKMQDRNLSVIKDFEEEDNEDDEGGESFSRNKSVKNDRFSQRKIGSQNSNSSSSDDESSRNKYIDIKKMLDNFLGQIIIETKNNRLEEIKKLFNEVSDRLTTEQKEELQKKKLIIINELGKEGSNPLHIAVLQQYHDIAKELVERGANVNVPDNQGWTSIQIAIHRNNIKILKLLLESPSLDLNYVSKAGTALTVSCQFSKPQALDLVLKKNPNIQLQDQQGKSCFDHCQNDECRNLLKVYQKQREEEEQKQNGPKIDVKPAEKENSEPGVFLPPKPPIVTGILFKIGAFLFNMRERFFVINPDEGTLIRYKSKQHYPLKPLEVIPLKDITHIQMITKSWFMSSDYTYFEINYPNRQVLACKHEQAAKKWVEYLFQACVYSYYTETKSAFNQMQMQDNVVVDLLDSQNQQPIFGALGGSIKEAVKKFEISKKKGAASRENDNSNEQTISKISSDQNKKVTNSKLTTKNTNAKPDSSNNLDLPSPQGSKVSSNPGSRNKLDGPNDSRKNTRSPSPPQDGSTRSQSPTALEDPNVDLGTLQDEKVTFESFQILKVLGAGSFGKVFLAKKKDTGNIYAIKALKKRPLIMKRQLRYAVTEANVLKMCNHPFILGLHFALQTPNYLYLVLDYCNGGDISSHLAYKRRFSEEEALFYIAELVLAIQHIHEKDVVYRDLKPENILIAGDGHIKLADFGLSKDNVTDQTKTKSFCGTPAYLSPEMLNNKGASKASDLYGIGAVLYEMLTGDPPYYNDDIPTMYKKIKEGNLTYPSYVSQKAKNIINGLLDRNPKTRLGAQDREQLKRDPFFEGIDWEKLYNKEYKPPITEFENSDIEEDFEDISDKKIFHDFDYEQHNHNINRVKQFSFVRKLQQNQKQ